MSSYCLTKSGRRQIGFLFRSRNDFPDHAKYFKGAFLGYFVRKIHELSSSFVEKDMQSIWGYPLNHTTRTHRSTETIIRPRILSWFRFYISFLLREFNTKKVSKKDPKTKLANNRFNATKGGKFRIIKSLSSWKGLSRKFIKRTRIPYFKESYDSTLYCPVRFQELFDFKSKSILRNPFQKFIWKRLFQWFLFHSKRFRKIFWKIQTSYA